MSKEEMIDYLFSTGLYEVDEKYPERSLFYEMRMMGLDKTVSIKELVESFISTDKEFNGEPWNIKQILKRISINL